MHQPAEDRQLPPHDYLAWTWTRPGEPAALQLQRKPMRAPAPGEVLLANRMVALNPVDWKMIEWGHAAWRPGHVPGVDGVGSVVATGEGVRLPIGARLAYHQDLARDGSFAEYIHVRADCLLPVPDGLTDELAAALPCPGLTAWQALQKVPGVPGRDILVSGAGGAVGSILTQLALQRGWRVWASAAPRHHARLGALGVAGAFDYREHGWLDALQAALGARRLFAAFDTVSGGHARVLAARLGYNGHLVCIQDRQEQAPLPAFTSAISLHEVALNSAHAFATPQDWQEWRDAGARMMEQLRIGNLQLPDSTVHAFAALPAALAGLKSADATGRQLIAL
jgi:NADPH:quinone reductase-like Zn-dependent oxidoreductase